MNELRSIAPWHPLYDKFLCKNDIMLWLRLYQYYFFETPGSKVIDDYVEKINSFIDMAMLNVQCIVHSQDRRGCNPKVHVQSVNVKRLSSLLRGECSLASTGIQCDKDILREVLSKYPHSLTYGLTLDLLVTQAMEIEEEILDSLRMLRSLL